MIRKILVRKIFLLGLIISVFGQIGCTDDRGKAGIVPRKRTFPLAMQDPPRDNPEYTVAPDKSL